MPETWEIIGGQDKGGILVREGVDLKSPQCKDRVSTGATVEELELVGERLHFKLIEGTGPAEGWVSIQLNGKVLACKKEAEGAAAEGPCEESGEMEMDNDTIIKVDKRALECVEKKMFELYAFKYNGPIFKFPLAKCKFRIFAFHNAGSAESVYTTPPKGPLITWIKEMKDVEIIACSYPGRDKTMKDKPFEAIDKLSVELAAAMFHKMTDGTPCVFWGHSVGTWVAFEVLMILRKMRAEFKCQAFVANAFPAPHFPAKRRPWKKSRGLGSDGIKQELNNWDSGHFGDGGAGTAVYSEPDWTNTWLPLMKADFALFDEYVFKHNGAKRFDFPIYSFHMTEEKYTKPEMVKMWGDWTTEGFTYEELKMGHLTSVYKPDLKEQYYTKVTKILQDQYNKL